MTALYHPRPERWPQFSLRGLFVVVTLLCVFLGWLCVQVKWFADRIKARQWIEAQHGVALSWEEQPGQSLLNPPPWPIRMLGEHGVWQIIVERRPDVPLEDFDAHMDAIERLFPEAIVHPVRFPVPFSKNPKSE